MFKSIARPLSIVAAAALAWAVAVGGLGGGIASEEETHGDLISSNYGQFPIYFESNQGQTAEGVDFVSRGEGYSLFLTPSEAVFSLRPMTEQDSAAIDPNLDLGQPASDKRAVLRMKIRDANPEPRITASEELPGKSNYFIGNDPSKWQTDVAHYARVEYADVYPGIDLAYYGNPGQLEYDFIVAPGADPDQIALVFEGADEIEIETEGSLVLKTDSGAVRQQKPLIYQETSEGRQRVEGKYVLAGENDVGFEIGRFDRSNTLVIDPVLVYSTYLGGSGASFAEFGLGIAVDSLGQANVTGRVDSADFPLESPIQPVLGGTNDAFIAKLNAAGTALVYSTFFGGSDFEIGTAIAADGSGNAYATGSTGSADFPLAGAFQPVFGGGPDAFSGDAYVVKLDATGSLVYSTYLGGSDRDRGDGIAVDAGGDAYVTGNTASLDFPTAFPFQPAFAGGPTFGGDGFVTRFNSTGAALVYSTYLGGSARDNARQIRVDGAGNAFVVGVTRSIDFPVTAGAFQPASAGITDVFVSQLNAAGSALNYSTYFGGSSSDSGFGIAIDDSGDAYITGWTQSVDLPVTPGAFQPAPLSFLTAFVARLNAAGSGIVYATYLGGTVLDQGLGIAVDSGDNAWVTGNAQSSNFPLLDPIDATFQPGNEAFITQVNPAGTGLLFSTFLGGNRGEFGQAIALDPAENVYITGATQSITFPTTPGAVQTVYGGTREVVCVKFCKKYFRKIQFLSVDRRRA